jgi:hypothetical protein
MSRTKDESTKLSSEEELVEVYKKGSEMFENEIQIEKILKMQRIVE